MGARRARRSWTAPCRWRSLTPIDGSGLRAAVSPPPTGSALKNPSRLVYDIAGKGFTRFRGTFDLENDRADIGSTLNPAVRFFVFDASRTWIGCCRRAPDAAAAGARAGRRRSAPWSIGSSGMRSAGRHRRRARRRRKRPLPIAAARSGLTPEGVADLLWAVLMKPEFQLIY